MLILLFICTNSAFPQNLVFQGQIGSFKLASSLSINSAGILYVADTESNEITKIDTLGKVLRTIGGYGWQESAFDDPADIFTNTLNVYVADKNNDRIQIFDKDLNYLSSFKRGDVNSNYSFRYPSAVAVSNQGDLFILDSDNGRILKFNFRGEFQLQIGGYDAGSYALSSPTKISITDDQKLLVIDENRLVEFDQFGNGLSIVDLGFNPVNINTTFQNICITDGLKIYFTNQTSNVRELLSTTFNPDIKDEIKDVLFFNSKLYVLTSQIIYIYRAVE